MEHYLDDDNKNDNIYHRKNEELSGRLQAVIDDADT
jgi:hypothetical protein